MPLCASFPPPISHLYSYANDGAKVEPRKATGGDAAPNISARPAAFLTAIGFPSVSSDGRSQSGQRS
jgi:hypothetical protein